MASYLQQIKEITDGLAAAGNIVEDIDLVFHILTGLSSDYDSFSTAILVKDPLITSEVLHSLLISEEICIENRLKSLHNNDPHAFNAYSNRSSNQSYRGAGRSNNTRGRGRPNTSNRNHNTTTSQTSEMPHLNPHNKCFSQYFSTTRTIQSCQICGKTNHTALDCFHQMNFAYAGRQPPKKLQAMVATSSRSASTSSSSPNWVLDSGATSHLTNDIAQLDINTPYHGADQIHTASGDYLPISNIGECFGDDSFPRSS
ncbi:hypothetical protein ACHQM5_017716 [Ranunculus cassubicifolius]